jgi:EmrB/QacA subfamily drug resistance transporter
MTSDGRKVQLLGVGAGNPWNALWTIMVGVVMILADSTIVAIANPTIMAKLHTSYSMVIWVTSAYLLASAVPLLLAGRLGDRFGPKELYLLGLAVFTVASLWCGLSGSIAVLIAGRVLQGIGAGLVTPQTLSTIGRIFPSERRGAALSVWGATAGVAILVGPLVGGLLTGTLGWQWIFLVNVPIGILGLALAARFVPVLPTHPHRFDWVGVASSGAGMILIVFGLQQGDSAGWAAWIWAMIVGGIGIMALFGYWQSVNTREPLVPLEIFGDRDFTLCCLGAVVSTFTMSASGLPTMFFAQAVCGLSPIGSALLIAPLALASGLLAPIVGKIVDSSHPRRVIGFGYSVLGISMIWLSIEMTSATPIWRLAVPLSVMGVGSAFIWAPLAASATRNTPSHLAGASSGMYNASRQLGAALGSASMAAFMAWRINADMPPSFGAGHPSGAASGPGTTLQLPAFLREPFATAMSESLRLPAFITLFGVVAALFMVGRPASVAGSEPTPTHTDG